MDIFNDYLYAFCLGSLDRDELKELSEYIGGVEGFDKQELGEYQNLVSLLPAILTIETPDPQLKDNVARKLYRLKDEIKSQRYKNKTSPRIQGITKEESVPADQEKPKIVGTIEEEEVPLIESKKQETPELVKEELPKPSQNKLSKSQDVSPLYKTYNPEEPAKEETRPPVKRETFLHSKEEKEEYPEEQIEYKSVRVEEDHMDNIIREPLKTPEQQILQPEKKSYSMAIIGFLLFFVVVIGIVIVYVKISSDVKEYKSEVDKLNKQISSLTMKLSSNQEIDQMLQSPNVQIINLKGTNLNTSGFGKLIISPEKGLGYIQLAQMPALPEKKEFQLWVSISGNSMSLGTFHASEKMEYYSFKIPTLPQGYDINFLVTEEQAGGAKTPGKKVYLTGNL